MYTLLLRYDNNVFYLAPRASITVSEPSDMETLNDTNSGCAGCGGTPNRSFKFTLYFGSSCSLASAWAMYNALIAFLNAACNKDLLLERRVQDETALVYKVTNWSLRMVDPTSQYAGNRRVLSMEISFGLTVWPPVGMGVVSVG